MAMLMSQPLFPLSHSHSLSLSETSEKSSHALNIYELSELAQPNIVSGFHFHTRREKKREKERKRKTVSLTSILGSKLDAGIRTDPLKILGCQLDDVERVLLQVPQGVVLSRERW